MSLSEAVREAAVISTHPGWQPLDSHVGIVELAREDFYVVARAGTLLPDLEMELCESGLTLGLPRTGHDGMDGRPDALHRMLDRGLPFAGPGTLRDLVLGATFVLADGTVAKSGSRVSKSVAGFDLHRFLVGAQGTLALFSEVTLRVRAADRPEATPSSARSYLGAEAAPRSAAWTHVQHMLPVDFERASLASTVEAAYAPSGLLWHTAPPEGGQWVTDREGRSPDHELWRRARALWDPNSKLNPDRVTSTPPGC